MPSGPPPYYVMPGGIFPTQSGFPVLITQDDFEQCCCCPKYPIYIYITGGYARDRIFNNTGPGCPDFPQCTGPYMSLEIQAIDSNNVRVHDWRGRLECTPPCVGSVNTYCEENRTGTIWAANGCGFIPGVSICDWCAPTDGLGNVWGEEFPPPPDPYNYYGMFIDNMAADITVSYSVLAFNWDGSGLGTVFTLSHLIKNSFIIPPTGDPNHNYLYCCDAYTGATPFCVDNAIGYCWEDTP